MPLTEIARGTCTRSLRELATERHMLTACPLRWFAVAATFLPLCLGLALADIDCVVSHFHRLFAFDAAAAVAEADSFAGAASF